ncbi:MAG TPA: hypothetical protein PLR71_04870 [Deltaproteobacteria bacterium]|nr:hypothetical protein [Deltaproteobacteria bacterium]HQI80877.1 hypothetical protein [Deltaproteobacteria bacterium]
MERVAPEGHPLPDKCVWCRACTECDEVQCVFHARGDPYDCAMEKCRYCMDFLKRQRLYMNNVG